MFWYGHGMNGWGWFAMSISMVVFWALIIAIGVLLYRALARPAPPGSGPTAWHKTPPSGSPEQILAERYARGEIDEEEYHRRLATLRGSPPGASSPP
ncbi:MULTISPECIES: SHOCT domain-containing protein [Streptomyces]|uniref:SHOCT domain-containing protein n=1 Tax=Streptomyces TaxID=1883 RepID=UPI000F773113|nr:SHOCT domain-containing protein [Streptomyces sp. WAC05858]RSS47704.1 SHOCT domain-containing protein [Streptomyces sp. WAC05858]